MVTLMSSRSRIFPRVGRLVPHDSDSLSFRHARLNGGFTMVEAASWAIVIGVQYWTDKHPEFFDHFDSWLEANIHRIMDFSENHENDPHRLGRLP